jgi:exopolysaccharide production protein ExoZ
LTKNAEQDAGTPGGGHAAKESGRNPQIRTIQGLRAIAALLVVGFHATVLWHDKFDPGHHPWENGAFGVDLFFVISGFVMVVSSGRLLRRADGWRIFMTHRLIRLVPLYWLATLAKLASVIAAPALIIHTRPTEWNVVASFLFLPARNGAGDVRSILDVGWTLSFEMLFYLAFAAAMLFAVDTLAVIAPLMAALALASLVVEPSWPAITSLASPIVLEFVFGVLLARWLLRSRLQLSLLQSLPLVVIGLCCLIFIPVHNAWTRVLFPGLAATLTIMACVAGERSLGRMTPRFMIRIGEASYSLYLTHGFILPIVGTVLAKTHLRGGTLGGLLVASSLIISTIAALIIYRFVEKPITDWLRNVIYGDRPRNNLAKLSVP